jgi:hypothetical protein
MSIKIKVPWLPFGWVGMAAKPFIFYKNNHPWWIFDHEEVHLRQQKRVGFFKYQWLYWTDRNFRFKMELEAYSVHMTYKAAEEMAKTYSKLSIGSK